jgi:hypothetical protein
VEGKREEGAVAAVVGGREGAHVRVRSVKGRSLSPDVV